MKQLASVGAGDLATTLANEIDDPQLVLETAASRLRQGDLTGIVVVDELNSVLRRSVEFVNGHASFELLAMKVEVVRHAGTRLFVPTVVGLASRRAAHGGQKPGFREAIEADPEVAAPLFEAITTLAESEGWDLEVKPRVAECRSAAGKALFWFNPGGRGVQFFVGPIRRTGRSQEASELLRLLARANGGPVTDNSPTLDGRQVLANWEAFVAAARYWESVQL